MLTKNNSYMIRCAIATSTGREGVNSGHRPLIASNTSNPSSGSLSTLFNTNQRQLKWFYLNKGPRRCVLPQCTVHLEKASAGRDWQRHDSIPGTLPVRDYSDVTLIPLHGWMLKNYSATNNSTSRVHILQVLRYPLSLLQPTQQHFLHLMTLNFISYRALRGDYSFI